MNNVNGVLLHELIDVLLVAVLILDLLMVASRKLKQSVWINSSQAVVLGLLPPFLSEGEWEFHLLLMSFAIIVVRGLVIPLILMRSIRSAPETYETRSLLTPGATVSIAALITGFCFGMGINLPLPKSIPHFSDLLVPTALTTIMIGLFMLIVRTQALLQVIGYLTIENGIFLFGLALVRETPIVVELGILLDVFVGVFVMGIVLFHISQAFEHLDTTELSSLRD